MEREKKVREVMNIYLSGRISGLSEDAYKANFADAEKEVRACFEPLMDVVVVNPAKIPNLGVSWSEWMLIDLSLLAKCDMIVMLPDWELSKGAQIEKKFAEAAGLDVKYL